MSVISVHLVALKQTKLHQYAIRFLIGGLCTVVAGLIGKRFGPIIGGLFLAFPAIFPAGASLIESQEKEKKEKIGADGSARGRMAASMDSAGAALGALGLMGFAGTSWILLKHREATVAITTATLAWLLLALLLWNLRRRRIFRGF
jgi:uncharacterized membrane protein (GlpM family)